jgi:hypothetical protein
MGSGFLRAVGARKDGGGELERSDAATIEVVPPTILPAPVRRRIFLSFGFLVLLAEIGSPSGPTFLTALPLLLKSKLQLSDIEQSTFLVLAAIPLYISPVFGFIRDLWNPFGMRDRGFILLFGSLTAAIYILLSFVPVSWGTALGATLLLISSFRLVASAVNGLLSTLGQQHTMSGQMSALWNVVVLTIGAAGSVLGGKVSDLLRADTADRAFHVLFLIQAAIVLGLVLYGWLRPSIVFDNVRAERRGRAHPNYDLGRLAKHWPIYPALLIWMLWAFAPGTDTALRNYLQDIVHATGTQYGEWSGLFSISFIPTSFVFGIICTRLSLDRLLLWGTLIGIPQMIPVLFVHSMNSAFVAAVLMGLTGGVATAAYMALIIRSCPPGLQGTVLMLSVALAVVSGRVGDLLGTRLYHDLGGFQICVIAITIVYTLILPTLLLIPRTLICTADGELGAANLSTA